MPEIRKGRYGVLRIYEISDEELETLSQGVGESVELSFAIFLAATAISFLVCLVTVKIDSLRTFCAFHCITIVASIMALVLGVRWWKTRRPISSLVRTIKERIPPEGEQEPPPADTEEEQRSD